MHFQDLRVLIVFKSNNIFNLAIVIETIISGLYTSWIFIGFQEWSYFNRNIWWNRYILQVKTIHGVYDLNTENTVIMVYVDIVLNYTMAVNYSIRSHCNMVQRGQFLHISCFDVNEKGCHINYDK